MAHGQANAEILEDKAPTLNCNHEQPIIAGTLNPQGGAFDEPIPIDLRNASRTKDRDEIQRQGCGIGEAGSAAHSVTRRPNAVAFKPSHYTRGKDGAPSEIAPPLSADADRGDQDTLIAFDTTQITSKGNYSNPKAGDPCHPLASQAHPPAVAIGFPQNMSGTQVAATENVSPVLQAKNPTAVAFRGSGQEGFTPAEISPPLTSTDGGGTVPTVMAEDIAAVQWASGGGKTENPTAQTLRAGAEHNYQFARIGMQVRRLTPTECLRLMGFPDDWFDGLGFSDSQKYKMCGNAVVRNVAEWLGHRIIKVLEERR
jgi:C-5 cytosine-specific DNA methylase